MKKALLVTLALSTLLFSSCSKEDDTPPEQNPPKGYTVPDTYTFTDEAGNNTVNFSGQTDRLNQLSEMGALMKTANTAGTAINAQDLKDMFANTNDDGNGNFSFTSTKQLRNKCATQYTDAEEVRLGFETMMDNLAAISQTTVIGEANGANGVAGIVETNSGSAYLMNENGMEYTQLIAKGLMGAVFYHQMTAYYLTDEKIGDGVDNSSAVDAEAGKHYTSMEHHWDEAFGYFTDATDYPSAGTDRFWGEYCNKVDPQLNSNTVLMNAFLKGRAAISNGDMETKNQQRDIIITEMERVIAAAAIHYMNSARDQFSSDPAKMKHSLSEGLGFINSLRFNPNPVMSTQEITGLKTKLGNNFYEITLSQILNVRDDLSTAYGMEAYKNDL